jgi:malate-CoA ligase subunit beta
MDIHEYQAKEILAKFGVTVPAIGALAYSPEQAAYRARELGGDRWIVKAQVHAGGRGKAGGVKLCNSEHEIHEATDAMFGRKIVTHQTGPEGKGIYRVYVETAVGLQPRNLSGLRARPHLAAGDDRRLVRRRHGDRGNLGQPPDSIMRSTVEPAVGLQEFQAREIAFGLASRTALVAADGPHDAWAATAPSAISTRPWSRSTRWSSPSDNRILALDAKMTFDDNALFRHPQHRRAARQEPGRPARKPGCRPGPVLYRPRRQHRLHRQRRGPGHGDDGHHQAGRRRACQLPRHRRRRHARARGQGVPPRHVGRERAGDPGQHLRRHQPLRLGGRGRGAGL